MYAKEESRVSMKCAYCTACGKPSFLCLQNNRLSTWKDSKQQNDIKFKFAFLEFLMIWLWDRNRGNIKINFRSTWSKTHGHKARQTRRNVKKNLNGHCEI